MRPSPRIYLGSLGIFSCCAEFKNQHIILLIQIQVARARFLLCDTTHLSAFAHKSPPAQHAIIVVSSTDVVGARASSRQRGTNDYLCFACTAACAAASCRRWISHIRIRHGPNATGGSQERPQQKSEQESEQKPRKRRQQFQFQRMLRCPSPSWRTSAPA